MLRVKLGRGLDVSKSVARNQVGDIGEVEVHRNESARA